MYYMKMLLKQAKEFEKRLSDETEVEKAEVVSVMKNKWEAERQEDNGVAGQYMELSTSQQMWLCNLFPILFDIF